MKDFQEMDVFERILKFKFCKVVRTNDKIQAIHCTKNKTVEKNER